MFYTEIWIYLAFIDNEQSSSLAYFFSLLGYHIFLQNAGSVIFLLLKAAGPCWVVEIKDWGDDRGDVPTSWAGSLAEHSLFSKREGATEPNTRRRSCNNKKTTAALSNAQHREREDVSPKSMPQASLQIYVHIDGGKMVWKLEKGLNNKVKYRGRTACCEFRSFTWIYVIRSEILLSSHQCWQLQFNTSLAFQFVSYYAKRLHAVSETMN